MLGDGVFLIKLELNQHHKLNYLLSSTTREWWEYVRSQSVFFSFMEFQRDLLDIPAIAYLKWRSLYSWRVILSW